MMALHRDIRFPKLRVLNMAQVNRGTLASDHDGDNQGSRKMGTVGTCSQPI